MSKWLKWILIILGSLFGLVVIAVAVVFASGRSRFNETYAIDVPSLQIPTDEAALARGAHLVNAVAHCAYCHGDRLQGDYLENDSATIGVVVAPNLTQGGELQGWTKEDFINALRTGTHPSGRQLSEFMPWRYFRNMTDIELGALWAFLNEQPARATVSP